MTVIRLALANAGVLVATGGIFAWAIVVLHGYFDLWLLDNLLRSRAEAANLDETPLEAHPVFLQLVDADGNVLARSSNLANHDLPLDPEIGHQAFVSTGCGMPGIACS